MPYAHRGSRDVCVSSTNRSQEVLCETFKVEKDVTIKYVSTTSELPLSVKHLTICNGDSQITDSAKAVRFQDTEEIAHPKDISATPLTEDDDCDDISIVYISPGKEFLVSSNALERLSYVLHKVRGDGNCLYHAVAHQAGFIEQNSLGDTLVAKQLRTLALQCMCKYPDVRNHTATVGDKKETYSAVDRMGW